VGRARTRLRAYLSDHEDVSQNGVSRSIGRGQSTISQFLKDTYNGDNEAVARDVLDWLQRERERAARPSIGDQVVVETSAYKRIQSVVRLTHEERDIGVVIGEAGLGKTLALQAYEADHERSVMRLEVGPEYRSRGLALELSRRCGGPDGGSIYKLMQAVYDELAGTDRLVIVDQAEILPTRGLELCRRLHDVCNIGVVLAGMPRLLANLQGSRGELKQLYSRVGFKARVEELSDEDVHLLVQAFTPGAEDGTVTAVAELTRNTRVATKILKRARHVAELNDTPVGPELIEHGQRMLVIPDPEGRS
jgi:DNA transposition AAA+ family ATPase